MNFNIFDDDEVTSDVLRLSTTGGAVENTRVGSSMMCESSCLYGHSVDLVKHVDERKRIERRR